MSATVFSENVVQQVVRQRRFLLLHVWTKVSPIFVYFFIICFHFLAKFKSMRLYRDYFVLLVLQWRQVCSQDAYKGRVRDYGVSVFRNICMIRLQKQQNAILFVRVEAQIFYKQCSVRAEILKIVITIYRFVRRLVPLLRPRECFKQSYIMF